MLLLLGLSTAGANNRCAVFASAVCELSLDTFVYSVCACSRTYGASSREIGKRHPSGNILLFAATVAAAAATANASTYYRRRRR